MYMYRGTCTCAARAAAALLCPLRAACAFLPLLCRFTAHAVRILLNCAFLRNINDVLHARLHMRNYVNC